GPSLQQVGVGAVELVALSEQGRGGGVEVLRSRVGGVLADGGVAAADEPEHLAGGVVGDGEHGPVAEPVDEAAVLGGGGQPGGVQLGVGDTVGAQVVDEPGPAG